jgi:hypothetical protein
MHVDKHLVILLLPPMILAGIVFAVCRTQLDDGGYGGVGRNLIAFAAALAVFVVVAAVLQGVSGRFKT